MSCIDYSIVTENETTESTKSVTKSENGCKTNTDPLFTLLVFPLMLLLIAGIPANPVAGQSNSAENDGESLATGPEANDYVALTIPEGSTYLSRYNMRVSFNGRYQGLRYLEIGGQLDRLDSGSYQSDFWSTAETTRDLRSVVAEVNNRQRSLLSPGDLVYTERPLSGGYPDHLSRFPEYRNFPVLPSALLYRFSGPGIPEEGTSWEAFAYRLVDPEGRGQFTPVQIYVRYFYRGDGEYYGNRVHFVEADFALRSDGRLTGFRVQGSNRVSMVITPGDFPSILMNNSIEEQYQMSDGSQLALQGFGLTWIRSPRPVYSDPEFIQRIAADPPNPGDPGPETLPDSIDSPGGPIELSQDELGLKLSLPDIKFEPDSAVMLPGEEERMATLIGILRQAGERRFLVTGHTADLGNPAGQQALSLERARVVARMLADAGIPPGSIRYEGRGALEPVGDNSTAEGRAQNRRVEIIILN